MNNFAFIVICLFQLVYYDILVDIHLWLLPEVVFALLKTRDVYQICAAVTGSASLGAPCR